MTALTAPASGTILDRILATKRQEVASLLRRTKRPELLSRCADLPPTRGFRENLSPALFGGVAEAPPAPNNGGVASAAGASVPLDRVIGSADARSGSPIVGGGGGRGFPRLIAEVKKASPSKGVIRPDFDPVAIASAYHAGGAACLSVLTDETYFQGSLSYLGAIRDAVPLPLLRKDFLIDPAQVYEARIAGADAVLLIVAAVPSAARLAELRHVAESVGMDALVEVHDAAELEIAAESGATLIGVNNRDLRDFVVRLEIAESLIPRFPAGTVAVAESGIFTAADAARMARAGAHAVLVGEALMREADVTAATRRLIAAAGGANSEEISE